MLLHVEQLRKQSKIHIENIACALLYHGVLQHYRMSRSCENKLLHIEVLLVHTCIKVYYRAIAFRLGVNQEAKNSININSRSKLENSKGDFGVQKCLSHFELVNCSDVSSQKM